jgi:chromate transporter
LKPAAKSLTVGWAISERDMHGRQPAGSSTEVFGAFLKLGLTSFGGPIAHLGYFRDEFVVRRRWIDEAGYADLVALCQFLPGPASSQTGFSLGLLRGGWRGALAAWCAFTLPSAIFLVLFAGAQAMLTGPLAVGVIHGLQVVAVAVVAQAVWGMARSLCPDRERASIAVGAVLVVTAFGGAVGQIAAIAAGGAVGLWLCRGVSSRLEGMLTFPVTKRTGAILLAVFFAVLIGLPLIAASYASHGLIVFDAFYRAGALVFGGGHVVLPLLEAEVVDPGWVSQGDFLAGYGAAQAVPGPLFTFSAYLGATMGDGAAGLATALLCLVAIFLPGLLLVTGALPFWDRFRANPQAQAAMRGTNAAVVGVLGAALYDPVWTSAIVSAGDFALALVGFALLTVWKSPPWVVVLALAAVSAVLSLG